MKSTKERAADNCQSVIETADRLCREHGFRRRGRFDEGGRRFTHGGFYNHFSSKAALAAENLAWRHAAFRRNPAGAS